MMPLSQPPVWPLPPVTQRTQGGMRRLGVEIEFAGLSLEQTAELVRAECGGEVRALGRYEFEVGDWRVELDFELLKLWGRRERDDDDWLGAAEALAEEALRGLSEALVPVEVIGPPLPMDQLDVVSELAARLRAAGARGTGDDWTHAFGMQFNPELPATDTATILAYLQAYLCLDDWLRSRIGVDLTRRLTFFADPFPAAYVREVLAPDYAPDLSGLIDDYLAANPTRNRGLDLLPLFTELDAARVRARVDDPRIKSRPTLHYRLPNSEIDRPDWDPAQPWADWLLIERLANDRERLATLRARYLAMLERPLDRLMGNWVEECGTWLDANGLC